MGQAKRITQILIANGKTLFRHGLRTLLSAESGFHVMDEACDASEALAKVRVSPPDVLVMDLALVGADGQETALALRHCQPSTSILFLTRQDEPEHLLMAVAAGARGYMLKDSTPNQLITAVREVAKSWDDGNPTGLSRLIPDLQALAESNQGYTRGTVLTAREQEVMRLLAEGRTVREVALELSLSGKTIEAHKLNLMRKLDIHNRASLVEYAHPNRCDRRRSHPIAERFRDLLTFRRRPFNHMRKFLLGVLVGVMVAVVGIIIIVLVIGRLAASRQPTVAANSVLVLALEGDVPEVRPVDLPSIRALPRRSHGS